jgi:hypothetical protein
MPTARQKNLGGQYEVERGSSLCVSDDSGPQGRWRAPQQSMVRCQRAGSGKVVNASLPRLFVNYNMPGGGVGRLFKVGKLSTNIQLSVYNNVIAPSMAPVGRRVFKSNSCFDRSNNRCMRLTYVHREAREGQMNRLVVLFLIPVALCGCQSSQKSKEELAAICADPANRQPGQYFFEQCQALYPASTKQLQQWYKQGAAM